MNVYESRYRRMYRRSESRWQALHAVILIALTVLLVLIGFSVVQQIDAEDKARFAAAEQIAVFPVSVRYE